MTDRFIGEVKQGGAVNFKNIFFNPHAHGTHTECLGHISEDFHSINKNLVRFHFMGLLLTVDPEMIEVNGNKDKVITKSSLENAVRVNNVDPNKFQVLMVRSLPNNNAKTSTNYSNTNPTYFSEDAMHLINDWGIEHLMTDMPSVDREEDGGKLATHHIFWDYPNNPQYHKTITELIYAPNEVEDGAYVVNIQITSLENDASPSKITLYELKS